jgi:hypothetical protein
MINMENFEIEIAKQIAKQRKQTFWPLSINLTAKNSLVHLSLTSLATPKFPDPISLIIS